jgi:hypothetical protein
MGGWMNIKELFRIDVLYQSDDWAFNVRLFDFDSSVNTLTYVFKIAGTAPFSLVSTPNGDGTFAFNVPAATTTTYLPGMYYVSAVLYGPNGPNGEMITATLGQTEILIKANLSLEGTNDPRSNNKIALDQIEAALLASAGSNVVEYSTGGTTVKKDREWLLKQRAYYLHRVQMENGKPGIGIKKFYL